MEIKEQSNANLEVIKEDKEQLKTDCSLIDYCKDIKNHISPLTVVIEDKK